MGFLDLFMRTNSTRNADEIRALREPKSKYYRLVQGLSITFLALAAILVLLNYLLPFFTENPNVQSWVLKICLVIVAVCGGGLCSLPWVYFSEREKKRVQEGGEPSKRQKYACLAFFLAIGLCVLLWIVAVFVVHIDTFKALIVKTSENATGEQAGVEEKTGPLGFLTFSILFSVQVGIASIVTASIIRYKQKHKAIRIINYICTFLTDIWVSWIAGAFFTGNLYREADTIMVPLDPHMPVLVVGILAAVGTLVSWSLLMNMLHKDRMRAALRGDTAALSATDEDFIQGTYETQTHSEAPAAPSKDAEEQLEKLARLREKGLISEEEYAEKRKEIIAKL